MSEATLLLAIDELDPAGNLRDKLVARAAELADMTTLPTPAELRELAEICASNMHIPVVIRDILRQFATLIEDAEKGVTDEVVEKACLYANDEICMEWPNPDDPMSNQQVREGMRAAIIAVAPLLALTKDKP